MKRSEGNNRAYKSNSFADAGKTIQRELHYPHNDNLVYNVHIRHIPLRQCNAMTTHKPQGSTIQNVILNCEGTFTYSMLYTAISRIVEPKNMNIISFGENILNVIWSINIWNRRLSCIMYDMLIVN